MCLCLTVPKNFLSQATQVPYLFGNSGVGVTYLAWATSWSALQGIRGSNSPAGSEQTTLRSIEAKHTRSSSCDTECLWVTTMKKEMGWWAERGTKRDLRNWATWHFLGKGPKFDIIECIYAITSTPQWSMTGQLQFLFLESPQHPYRSSEMNIGFLRLPCTTKLRPFESSVRLASFVGRTGGGLANAYLLCRY
jgi:hypothetical protein